MTTEPTPAVCEGEDDEPCPRCGSGDVPLGYWICPVCDAEWPDEDEADP